jgi:transposase
VTLVDKVLAQIKVPINGPGRPKSNPKRLIGDRAYDSDKLRKDLRNRQIALIGPHRKNRKKPKVQDGRKLRRYRKRWKIERTFSWTSNYRRLVVRYERRITVYQAFFHVACILFTLKQF